jgi:hypothetical protein
MDGWKAGRQERDMKREIMKGRGEGRKDRREEGRKKTDRDKLGRKNGRKMRKGHFKNERRKENEKVG